MPHLGAGGDHVGGHTYKGDGEVEEVALVGVPYDERPEKVGDVLSLHRAADEDVAAEVPLAAALGEEVAVQMAEGEGYLAAGIEVFLSQGIVAGGDEVAQEGVPRLGEEELLELLAVVAAGVESAHKSADAGADNEVGAQADAVEVLQHSDMGRTFGSAAAEHESHRGTVLADAVHPCAESGKSHRVKRRVHPIGQLLPPQSSRTAAQEKNERHDSRRAENFIAKIVRKMLIHNCLFWFGSM